MMILGPAADLDRHLVRGGTAHRLAFVRTGLTVGILMRLVVGRWWTAGRRPDAFFDPVFAVRSLGSVPPTSALIAVQVTGAVAALAVITNRRVTAAFPLAWTSYLVLAGLWSSAGKIQHNDILLILASVPFLFAPADARIGDTSTSTRWGWPPRVALSVIGLVYFMTGFQKLRHGGLDWITSDSLRWVFYAGARTDRSPLPGLAHHIADLGWLCHLLAAATLLTELSAPVVLFVRRSRPWFFAAVALLHGTIWLTLGLDYSAWVVCVFAVVVLGSHDCPAATDNGAGS